VPHLIVTEGAARGLERCRQFLAEKSPEASQRAADVILRRIRALETTPDMGRPFDMDAALRELPISFGASGYIALYRHEPADDAVYLLAFRHQRESGYA